MDKAAHAEVWQRWHNKRGRMNALKRLGAKPWLLNESGLLLVFVHRGLKGNGRVWSPKNQRLT